MLRFVSLASAVLSFSTCTTQNTEIYEEWRDLSEEERGQYVQAVMCLADKPSQLKLELSVPIPQHLIPGGHPASKSRLDDFTYVRMRADGISSNLGSHPQYLPWHRVFLRLFDTALRTECNYKGSLPYWDISADYGRKHVPEILNYFNLPKLGPLKASIPNDHEVIRPSIGRATNEFSPETLKLTMQHEQYYWFMFALRNMHEVSLRNMDGDIWKFATAPNDPIYYLLQRNVDRLWYFWQLSWQKTNTPKMAFYYQGASGTSIPLHPTDKMQFFGLLGDVTVREALNPMGGGIGGLMCYKYSRYIPKRV